MRSASTQGHMGRRYCMWGITYLVMSSKPRRSKLGGMSSNLSCSELVGTPYMFSLRYVLHAKTTNSTQIFISSSSITSLVKHYLKVYFILNCLVSVCRTFLVLPELNDEVGVWENCQRKPCKLITNP